MRKIGIIISLFCALLAVEESFAQESKPKSEKQTVVYKTTKEKTPDRVKESLKSYSNYKVAEEVTYVKRNDQNVYKFKVEKGNWSHYLLISEKGKILGIETGEH